MASTTYRAAQHDLYLAAPSVHELAFEPRVEFGFDDASNQEYLAMQAGLGSLHSFNQESFVYDPAGTVR